MYFIFSSFYKVYFNSELSNLVYCSFKSLLGVRIRLNEIEFIFGIKRFWSQSNLFFSRQVGKQFEFMGSMVEGRLELRPEEGLYLMECSQLGAILSLNCEVGNFIK